MAELKGSALVTGASSGIGATYADRLARRGHNLVLVARDVVRLEALADRLRAETGRTIDILPADLADRAQLARITARLASHAGIDILVNNAGTSLPRTLLEDETGPVETLLVVNVVASTLLAQAAAKAFLSRGRGAIINIASVLASKLEGAGVRVQAVMPGMTRTEIFKRAGKDPNALPPEMMMEVGDLVDAALVGFDRGEIVTIPPLADDADWQTMEAARRRLAPHLSRREPAPRYRIAS